MNLSNISSVIIDNKFINHIETVYNPNLKEIYKASTIMTKTAIEEMINGGGGSSAPSAFYSKFKEDMLFDKSEVETIESGNFKAVPYNYNINTTTTTLQTTNETTDVIYVPSYYFIKDDKFLNVVDSMIFDKYVSKISLSRGIKDASITNNTDQILNVYYPCLDLSMTLSENVFYVLGHGNTYKDHNVLKNLMISQCDGIVLGMDYFDGLIDENSRYGNFSQVGKVYVYINSFKSGVETLEDKRDVVSEVLNITTDKIFFYGSPSYIYDITASDDDKYKFENENGIIIKFSDGLSHEINIDTISNGRNFVLDLSEASGEITISRNSTSKSNYLLTELIIGDNVSLTTTRGFDKCRELKKVITSVSSANLFTNCYKLEYVKLTGSTIGANCFKNCASIREISIPVSVVSIDSNAFTNCESLEKVYITGAKANPITFTGTTEGLKENCEVYVLSIDEAGATSYFLDCLVIPISSNILYYSGANPEIDFSQSYGDNLVILPNPNDAPSGTLTKINSGGNIEEKLDSLVLDKIEVVGDSTFKDCFNLKLLSISTTITDIGNEAFKNCSSLTSVTIPTSISKINNGVFENCTGLTKVIVSENLTEIGENAFNGCTNLDNLTN